MTEDVILPKEAEARRTAGSGITVNSLHPPKLSRGNMSVLVFR